MNNRSKQQVSAGRQHLLPPVITLSFGGRVRKAGVKLNTAAVLPHRKLKELTSLACP